MHVSKLTNVDLTVLTVPFNSALHHHLNIMEPCFGDPFAGSWTGLCQQGWRPSLGGPPSSETLLFASRVQYQRAPGLGTGVAHLGGRRRLAAGRNAFAFGEFTWVVLELS